MKKTTILLLIILCASKVPAQLKVSGTYLKMSDVISYYNKYQKPFRNTEGEPDQKRTGLGNSKISAKLENKDYQFDRWKWFWQQHQDGNGYLVSPVKTFNSWNAYQEREAASRITATSGANWVFQGDDSSGASGSGVGRINVVAFHPTNANTYWIGSPGGGAWKTTNNGSTWTNMTNSLPLLSVTDIKFNPSNPNTIYMCTGDRDGNDYYSVGLLKSYNGGTTWLTTGITYNEYDFHEADAILINPLDTNSLIYASDQGIYRSFNGGTSWVGPVVAGDFMQLVYHPTDTNIVYATSYYNYSTSAPGQIYRSADGGMTWRQVTSFTDCDRVTVAVTPANVATVKAIVSASDPTNQDGLEGIYSSSDTGNTFTQIFTPAPCSTGFQNLLSFNQDGSACGGQGFYDLTLAIDPTNANNVICGGVNAWSSNDGGVTWQILNQWDSSLNNVATIHADKHFMGFDPLVPGRFFESNDGGIYYTSNPTATSVWNNVTNGLGITEFYRMTVSNQCSYEVAGAQDVGTKYIQNFQYQDADGGDGMECHIDPADSTIFYASVYYGEIDQISTVFGYLGTPSNNIPGTPTGGWVTPYIIEPTCHTCLIAGYQQVYWTNNQGNTWSAISGSLTSGDLLRVVATRADSNTLYAADDGSNNLYYTYNKGATWTNLTAPYSSQVISDVMIDPRNKYQVWVAFGGYSSLGSPQVVSYNEPTNTWTSFNSNLPDVPVNCLLMDPQNRTMYAGTEVGVFYRDTTMTEWEPFSTGMPSVSVTDLQLDSATSKVWASTFGRSLWSSSKHVVTSHTDVTNITEPAHNLNIMPNPNRGSFIVKITDAMNNPSATFRLMDARGNVAWSSIYPVAGNSTVNVSLIGVATGDYILQVVGANGVIGEEKVVIY